MSTHDLPTIGVVGTQVGEYRLYDFLGRKRYTEVFRCTFQGRWWSALKIEAIPLEGGLSRLYKEFNFCKTLLEGGAHVPSVSWLGQTPDGQGYAMAMEFLHPTVEEQRLGYGIMPSYRVLKIARDALHSIKSIHGLNVVLGGVSGRNLAYNAKEIVIFTDFGRAKGGVCFVDEIIECSYRVDLMQLALVLFSLTGAVVPQEPKNPTAQQRLRFQDELKKVDIEKIGSQLPSLLAPLGVLLKHTYALKVADYPGYDLILEAFRTGESSY